MANKNKNNSLFGKKITHPGQRLFKDVLLSRNFGILYFTLAISSLTISVIFWSILGAKVQLGNADQIINSQLFNVANTFSKSTLPASHTFLIKWPIFYIVSLLGSTKGALVTLTVLTVLLTVGLFVLILRSIEKRPLYLGTICLALASVLMLIPALPYPGGLLPVNMAMIATRNLEYILYIFSAMLLIRSPKLRSKGFWIAVVLLSFLAASDKLFLIMSLGGAIIAMIYYGLYSKTILDNLATKWLIGSIAAGAGSLALVWFITVNKFTSFTSHASLSPYGLATSMHSLFLGVFYGITSIFTNLGANPAANVTIIRSMPSAVIKNFFTFSFLGFFTNLIVLIFGLYIAVRLIRETVSKRKPRKKSDQDENNFKLAVILIWTSISGYVVFVISNHDYSVDARYLGIVSFAIFVSLAVYSARQKIEPEILTIIGLIIGISVISGTYFAWHSYKADVSALSSQNNRNSIVAEVLSSHTVDALVGDYWRVVPIKLDTGNQQNIIPLEACINPRSSLISSNWLTNLNKSSFAYLLSLSGGNLTNYPHCTINQVISYYGRPSSSQVIAGSLAHPEEILLFYPNGRVKKPADTVDASTTTSTILPVNISSLPSESCDAPTSVNIIAHEDDDLLFMNPDILNEIKQGYCERTIYITAGDAGDGIAYYLSRQDGAEAAYAEMTGTKDLWTQKTIQLASNEYVTFANLEADSKITLVFMHLPDGGIQGQGFKLNNFQSIDKLYGGSIKTITTVDSQSVYTTDSLESALTNLMLFFGPSEIRTQSTYGGGKGPITDHPDHNTVGRLATVAAENYNQNQYANLTAIPVKYYEGYPIRDNPVNLSGVELNEKEAAFLAYSVYDGSTCASLNLCEEIPTYWGYLHRQYTLPY